MSNLRKLTNIAKEINQKHKVSLDVLLIDSLTNVYELRGGDFAELEIASVNGENWIICSNGFQITNKTLSLEKALEICKKPAYQSRYNGWRTNAAILITELEKLESKNDSIFQLHDVYRVFDRSNRLNFPLEKVELKETLKAIEANFYNQAEIKKIILQLCRAEVDVEEPDFDKNNICLNLELHDRLFHIGFSPKLIPIQRTKLVEEAFGRDVTGYCKNNSNGHFLGA